MPALRPLRAEDVAEVIALNQRNVSALTPLDEEGVHRLRGHADRFDVIDADGSFAGFVVTVGPGSTYDSENYRWFAEHYADRFYYLDRVVLHEEQRRRGLGSFVYDEIEAVARAYDRLALEVNLQPRNEGSLAFHAGRGFTEVGRLGDETHLVSLMVKLMVGDPP